MSKEFEAALESAYRGRLDHKMTSWIRMRHLYNLLNDAAAPFEKDITKQPAQDAVSVRLEVLKALVASPADFTDLLTAGDNFARWVLTGTRLDTTTAQPEQPDDFVKVWSGGKFGFMVSRGLHLVHVDNCGDTSERLGLVVIGILEETP